MSDAPKDLALAHFKGGLFCAESVLLALAQHLEIESDFLPAIATGFCGGQARTAGQCGAVSGAVMGLGLAFGRNNGQESVAQAYAATQTFLKSFEAEFGSCNCAELLGCHLGTPEGQATFKDNNLSEKCLNMTGRAAELAVRQIDDGGAKTR